MKIAISYDHPNFSYMIYKKPGNIFEKKVNSLFNVIGKFVDNDPQIYTINCEYSKGGFIEYCRDKNFSHYLLKEKYIVSPLNIEAINIVFRSAIRENYNDIRKFKITIKPIYIYNYELFVELFNELAPKIYVYNLDYTKKGIAEVELHGKEKLHILLQKLYILLYVYTISNRTKVTLPNKDRLEKFKKFLTWLNKDSKMYNLIISRLGQNKFGKDYIKGDSNKKKIIRLGDRRYPKICSLLTENDRILDIGCGNGKLVQHIIKNKVKIASYVGIDNNVNKIQQARDRFRKIKKFKFFASSIYYPIKEFFDKANTIILTEVIEHLPEDKRYELIKFLIDNCRDKKIIITVPNYEVNKIYFNLDGYRHKNHKIEYTYEQFKNEILAPFTNYRKNVKEICIIEEFIDFKDQITFACMIE